MTSCLSAALTLYRPTLERSWCAPAPPLPQLLMPLEWVTLHSLAISWASGASQPFFIWPSLSPLSLTVAVSVSHTHLTPSLRWWSYTHHRQRGHLQLPGPSITCSLTFLPSLLSPVSSEKMTWFWPVSYHCTCAMAESLVSFSDILSHGPLPCDQSFQYMYVSC